MFQVLICDFLSFLIAVALKLHPGLPYFAFVKQDKRDCQETKERKPKKGYSNIPITCRYDPEDSVGVRHARILIIFVTFNLKAHSMK